MRQNRLLVFGHTGITLGIAVLLNGAIEVVTPAIKRNKSGKHDDNYADAVQSQDCPSSIQPFSFTSLGTRLDIRLLLIGSLLPDVIDKPLGRFLVMDTFGNGRIFSHTLLFLIIATIAGYYLYRKYRKSWLLAMSPGIFLHLALDRMWLTPKTLFWPLYGLAFEKSSLKDWIGNILHALFTDPGVYIPEVIGIIILTAFMVMLMRKKKLFSFIGNGGVG